MSLSKRLKIKLYIIILRPAPLTYGCGAWTMTTVIKTKLKKIRYNGKKAIAQCSTQIYKVDEGEE